MLHELTAHPFYITMFQLFAVSITHCQILIFVVFNVVNHLFSVQSNAPNWIQGKYYFVGIVQNIIYNIYVYYL